jgi:hypothetical protein
VQLTPRGAVNVLRVDVSRRVSGSISSDNAAADSYSVGQGTSSLGLRATSVPSGCWAGIEFVGTVQPSTYTERLLFERTLLSWAIYKLSNSMIGGSSIPADDMNGNYSLQDNDPQSGGSNGKI